MAILTLAKENVGNGKLQGFAKVLLGVITISVSAANRKPVSIWHLRRLGKKHECNKCSASDHH
jgi:hypothetical protein